MHPGLGAVIGAAGTGDFKMKVIGEHRFLDILCHLGRVKIGKGAYIVADAGADVSGPGSRISGAGFCLIDLQKFYNGLKLFVDLIHVLQTNPLDLKTLAGSEVDIAVAVFLGNLLDQPQNLSVEIPAGYTDPGGPYSPDFGHAEGIFLQFLCIDI